MIPMKFLKQFFGFLLCAAMTVSLAACGSSLDGAESSGQVDTPVSGSDVELLHVGCIYEFDVERPY